jgi:lipid-A-disaccharide synthase
MSKLPAALASKCQVVGDLMADTQALDQVGEQAEDQGGVAADGSLLIALMPGSKPGKLRLCLPLMLAVAERLQQALPIQSGPLKLTQIKFIIPVAPMLGLREFAGYANAQQNSALPLVGGVTAQLQEQAGQAYLVTQGGLQVQLWTRTPAYDLLRRCQFCLTTIGANTAELASLAIPMVVLLPMQELWQDWDGLPGLLTRLPWVGKRFGNLTFWLLIQQQLGWRTWRKIWAQPEVNWGLVKQGLGLRAWPNLWAGREIVPELVGALTPDQVTPVVLDLLQHPESLAQMQARLAAVRGATGAAAKLTELVVDLVEEMSQARQNARINP